MTTPQGSGNADAPSLRAVWTGRAVSALAVLFLAFDTAVKLLQMPLAAEANAKLGFTESTVLIVGIIEAVCLALYLLPRTSILAVVLWTGYFGGAIAIHLRAGSPLLSHTLFPLVIAALLWVGLWLRDLRLRRAVRTALSV